MSRRTGRVIWKVKIAAAVLLPGALFAAGCQGPAAQQESGEQVRLVITPVATPTQTPLAQPTAAPVTYTVKSGDTLSGIASLFGVTVDDIIRTNNIADPNSLAVGQILTIPGRIPPATPTIAASVGGSTPVTATLTVTGTLGGTPTLPPVDATPPQGPTVGEPGEGATSSPGPTNSPTASP